MRRVLAVDDEPVVLDSLNMMLRRLGYQPILAMKGERAIALFREDKPHLTILDLGLPDINGLEVLRRIRRVVPDAPVIILTGAGTEAMEIEARELGVSDFILKGFSFHALKTAIDNVLEAKEQKGQH